MTTSATPAVFVLSSSDVWGISEEVWSTSTAIWEAEAEVWGTSTQVWGTSVVIWGDLVGIATFVVVGIPELVAVRSVGGTSVTLKVLNSGLGNTGVRYWQATGIQSNFVFLDNSSSPGSDFELSGIGVSADTDYKFKASFTVTGLIDGVSVELVGGRCAPVYVIAPANTL